MSSDRPLEGDAGSSRRAGTGPRAIVTVALRVAIGWIFLWASIHHYGNHAYVAGFLEHTKTFHGVYAGLAQQPIATVIAFIVEYGQILIAASLILGAFFRVGAAFGALLLMIYWTANMDFPFISSADNFLVDEHLIFALTLGLLSADRAGQVWGVDRALSRHRLVRRNAVLRWCTDCRPG